MNEKDGLEDAVKMTGVLTRYFDDIEEIGRGGFGVVFRANSKHSAQMVAIKRVKLNLFPERNLDELRTLEKMKHPNIVRYLDAFEENGYQYIVMEYCKHGDLRSYLRQHRLLSDQKAAYVMSQLIAAVEYIHQHRMMHRDLSAGNVLISAVTPESFLDVKLTDFGLATKVSPGKAAMSLVGTPGYIAPQVYNRRYSHEADVYSLGAILYKMLTGRDPQPQKKLDLHTLSSKAAHLIVAMMDIDAAKRIKLADIRNSEFMKTNDPDPRRYAYRRINSMRTMSSKDSGHGSIPSAGDETSRRMLTEQRRSRLGNRWTGPIIRGRQGLSADSRDGVKTGQDEAQRRHSAAAERASSPGTCCHSIGWTETGTCRRCGGRRSLVGSRRIYSQQQKGHSVERCHSYLNTGECGGLCKAANNVVSNINNKDLNNKSARGSSEGPKLAWPLLTTRLDPCIHFFPKERCRCKITEEKTVVVEFLDRKGYVSSILHIEPQEDGRQEVRLYEAAEVVQVSNCETGMARKGRELACYRSLDTMPRAEVVKYSMGAQFVRKVGGRKFKLKAYSTAFPNAVAKIMENGDFRLLLADGRQVVQRFGNDSPVVSRLISGKELRSELSETEKAFFEREWRELSDHVDSVEARGNPRRFPLVMGTPSPSPQLEEEDTDSGANSKAKFTNDRVQSRNLTTPVSRLGDAETSRRQTTALLQNKENLAPSAAASSNERKFLAERDKNGQLLWLKCLNSGNRIRISRQNARIVYYRLADGSEKKFDLSKSNDSRMCPAEAQDMLRYLQQLK